jgi:hypothetical protein
MTYLEGLPEPPASQASPAPGRGRRIAIAVASVAVVLAGVFAAVNIAAGEENEPTDPVRAMIEAAERGDAIGILEQLEPGERDALRDPLVAITSELNRLGILEGASLSKLSGYELDVTDLELEASEVADGIQSVRITSGTSTYSVDPSEFPVGPFVRELTGDEPLGEKDSGESDIRSESEDDEVVVVKRGGRWYVSIGYTIAESARRAVGVTIADMGPGVTADGADSPEDAVRDLLMALSELDVRRMIELLPPGEMGALQAYAGLFIEEAEGAAHLAGRSASIAIPKLDLDADTDGSRSLVTVRDIEIEATVDGGGTFSYKDGCLRFGGPGQDPIRICEGDDPSEIVQNYLGVTGFPMPDLAETPEMPAFSFLKKQIDLGFTTTRVDGKWYVSPVRTWLDSTATVLEAFEPGDLDLARDWVGELQTWMLTAFTGFDEEMIEQFEEFDGPSFSDDVPDGESPVSIPRTGY